MMRNVARDLQSAESEFLEIFVKRPIRPFPETYDRRSARVRASLLVQIIAGKPRDPVHKGPFEGSAVFENVASRDIPYFFPNQRRPDVSNPANRVILPEGYGRNARSTFVQLTSAAADREVLASHFITDEAFDYLKDDNFESFIKKREQTILAAEDKFLSEFGLSVDRSAERNSEEIDSEE